MKFHYLYHILFLLSLTNVAFNQKLPKDVTPNSKRRILITKDANITVFILFDQNKLEKKVEILPNLTYHFFRTDQLKSSKGSYNGHLLNGNYRKEYRSHDLWESGCFSLGLQDGLWISYYPNGQTKSIENWDNGIKNGSFIYFDSLGNITKKESLIKGIPNGVQIDAISGDTLLYSKGKKEGVWLVKNEELEIIAVENYKNNLLEGTKYYLNNKDTIKLEKYKKGLLNGYTVNFENQDSILYKNNKKNGITILHSTGGPTTLTPFSKGKIVGRKLTINNGDTLLLEEYKNNLLDGLVVDFIKKDTSYYSKGKLIEAPTVKTKKEKKQSGNQQEEKKTKASSNNKAKKPDTKEEEPVKKKKKSEKLDAI